ncbi:MAG: TerB family tellurite resistance protein [Chitinophagaceae bacterium]|nr:TerB family tellurite resistance protein [Chitinophagaceae bacterium]
MQRAISGYHLLMILTNVDGKLNVNEDLVIRDWLSQHFLVRADLDKEMEVISTLERSDYPSHFHTHMNLFYQHSEKQDRLQLLQFAMNIIKADGEISNEENTFFNELYDAWNEEAE